jgi:aminoglycoside phosphotransferase (APT) family kinase protein
MSSASADRVPPGLALHLHDAYGLAITTITPVPKGEDADAYRATAREGARYFVRVEHGRADDRLEVALAVSAALRVDAGLCSIVVPLPTMQGAFTSHVGNMTIAVFPFVDGTTATDRPFSDPDWRRLAAIMAALHASEMRASVRALPRETFANPYANIIKLALQRADSTDTWPSSLQRQAMVLLQAQRADIEAMMTQFERLGEQARRQAPGLVPTHGDPNLSNVLLDNTGALRLIDWGGLGLGPRERDLFAFTGDRFASFLEAYLARTGPVQLHLDLFAFYSTRWVLQEIADYTSRLLLAPGDAEAQAHAWQELQPYLPIPHAALAADSEAVQRALAPFVRTGLVNLCQSPA